MSFITANDTAALIDQDVSAEIISDLAGGGSRVLPLFKALPQMSSKQTKLRVLSALPTAYFVSGATTTAEPGTKQQTRMAWENVYVNAEELAVIVPIPEELLEDAEYDIWAQVKPALVEAFGVAIDAAVLHGTNAPAAWPDDLFTQATAAGNVVALGNGDDVYDDILATDGVFATVESDGYIVRGAIADVSLKAILRGLRTTTEGMPIFKQDSVQGATVYSIDGVPIQFPETACIDPDAALMFAGDFGRYVYAMRQDITYKVLSEATLTDGSGSVLYNLAEQDMVALRAVMRLGWAAPNPINRRQASKANRCPVGILAPDAGSGS